MKINMRNHTWLWTLLLATITASINPTSAQNVTAYVPAEKIFLNCGAELSDPNGVIWEGDIGSAYAPDIENTVSTTPSIQDPSIPMVPYMTARIFLAPYTYSFPVIPGRKFVRLHFYPSNFTNTILVASDSFFSVSVGSHTLLNNFSALLTTQAMNYIYMSKEFSINISSRILNLTFTPSPANC